MRRITVLTLFPTWFEGPFDETILARAEAAGIVLLSAVDIRDYTTDKHRRADEPPYGGGGGMLMKPEPVAAAIDDIAGPPGSEGRARVIYTSPRGRTWDQPRANELAAEDCDLVILCGRYEGIDERVIASRVDEEISLGDFVMTGGEITALALIDSIVRLMPGVLGNETSAPNDSFYNGLLEGPHFTRPETFEGERVPDVLLSGNHAAIDKWRHEQALRVTKERRPDLYQKWLKEKKD